MDYAMPFLVQVTREYITKVCGVCVGVCGVCAVPRASHQGIHYKGVWCVRTCVVPRASHLGIHYKGLYELGWIQSC